MAASIRLIARTAKPPRYPFAIEIKYARILVKLVNEIESVVLFEIKRFGPDIINQADITFLRKDEIFRSEDLDFHSDALVFHSDALASPFGWAALLNDMIERIALGITAGLLAALERVTEISAQTNFVHKKDFMRQAREAYGRIPIAGDNRLANSISSIGKQSGLRSVNPLAVNILNNEPTLPALLSAWEQNNIALIKSIPDGIVGQLRSEFSQAFVNGTNLKDLTQIVQDRSGVGKSRAQLIARDQIGKLNGQLSEMRQKAAGIESYVWRSAGDERVRLTHRVRNGKIYKWSDPGIKPGSEIRCRCVAAGVFPDLD